MSDFSDLTFQVSINCSTEHVESRVGIDCETSCKKEKNQPINQPILVDIYPPNCLGNCLLVDFQIRIDSFLNQSKQMQSKLIRRYFFV